ncbi:transmembrane protein, putative [Bodo saltans]|uniref:Transmembrane protein, putative n=1 Tax=Bodo saltans TaxID=75058 RepID=A0A0S4IW08_BODSA|nr:transmembrane protein, putative [Bodo saltans]|eukprot:CUF95218.1 transmembrane protein, putative [Bodo saltans]
MCSVIIVMMSDELIINSVGSYSHYETHTETNAAHVCDEKRFIYVRIFWFVCLIMHNIICLVLMDVARPEAISRAYDLLSKVAAYKADIINSADDEPNTHASPTNDEDEFAPPTHSPSTHSPMSTDGRRSTSSTAVPAAAAHRVATPTLDIIPAYDDLVSTAVQTSTPLWGAGGGARGVPLPPPPPRVAVKTSTSPKRSQTLPAQQDSVQPSRKAAMVDAQPLPTVVANVSLTQSTVPAASGDTTLDTSGTADDSRRVVIHSLTPPRVTTVLRQQRTAMTPPQGFFSQEIVALDAAAEQIHALEHNNTPVHHHHHPHHHRSSNISKMRATTTTTVTSGSGNNVGGEREKDEEEKEIDARHARAVKSLSDRFAHIGGGLTDDDRNSTFDDWFSHQQLEGMTAAERLSRRTAADVVFLRRDATEIADASSRRFRSDNETDEDVHGTHASGDRRRIGLDLANVDLDWLLRSHKRTTPAQLPTNKALKGQRASAVTPPPQKVRGSKATTPVTAVSLVRDAPEPSNNPPTPTPRHGTTRTSTPTASSRYLSAGRPLREDASPPRAHQETFSSSNRKRLSSSSGLVTTPQRTLSAPHAAPIMRNVVHHPHPERLQKASAPTISREVPTTRISALKTAQEAANLSTRATTPQQRVSDYTKKLLKEHQDRIASQRSHLPKRVGGPDISTTSLNISTTTVTTTSKRHARTTAELEDWEPMPNRHALGASLKIPHRNVSTKSAAAAPPSQAQSGVMADAAGVTPSSSAFHYDSTPAVDLSHISAASRHHQSAVLTPHHQQQRTSSHVLPRSSASVPLMEYLFTVVAGGPASFINSELASMPVIGKDNGRSVSFTVCRAWAALTMMINQPVCLEEVVVPLLISELQNRMNEYIALGGRVAGGMKDPSIDIAHLLCAFIGIGGAAKAALEILLEMLENGVGDANLVGLAVRVCGGEAAVRKLCTMASDAGAEYGPQTQLAAVNALALLPSTIAAAGHTAILCVGLPQLQGSKMFYQPRGGANEGNGSSGGDGLHDDVTVATRPVLTPHQIGYRTTFIIFDAEMVRRHLASVTTTALYQKRWREQPSVSYAVILRDFFSTAAFVCNRMQCDPNVNHQLAAVEADATPWLDGEDQVHAPVLANSLEYLWQKEPLLGRHITMTLIRLLHSRSSMPALLEAALRTIAVLPPLASEVLAEPLVEYTTMLVDLLHAAPVVASAQQVQLIKEAILSTCRVVNPEVHPQKLVDSATAIAVHLLRNDDASLSRAGCIALGTMGPISSNPHAIIKLIVETLMEGRLSPKTCCWALARSGRHGAACLVDIASQVHLGPSQRVEAARALGFLTITSGAGGEGSELITGAVSGLMRLVVDHMTRPSGDALAVAALHSLVELHQRAHKRGEHRLEYATTSTLCNMLQDVLRHHTIGSARPTLLQELFLSLCRFGGPRGLLIVGDIVHGDGEHTASLPAHAKVEAAFGLRAAGADCASILASALSHENVDVRTQAADTLVSLGNPALLAASVKNAGTTEAAQRHLSNALHLHPSGKVAALIESWLHRLEQENLLSVDGVF